MKVAWNRTTVETLELALSEALPRAKMVCRDEQYKNKAMVMFAMEKYSRLLTAVEYQKRIAPDPQTQLELSYNPRIRQLQKDFKRLFALYTQILLSESLASNASIDKNREFIRYDSYITCSYCRCNIFNRFLTCPTCIIPLDNGGEDTYDICLECYAMGRSCRCNSGYKWVEQFPWTELTQKHEAWRNQIIEFDGLSDKSPASFPIQRQQSKVKTLAQVCYEQLKVRPWLDPKKELPIAPTTLCRESVISEDAVNADGSIKKKKSIRRSKAVTAKYPKCHVCLWPEFEWKLQFCDCGRAYCYGSLFRAFDQTPLSVLQNLDWKCPYCLKICCCGSCRRLKNAKPYEPKNTLLGYDVKKVADPRSWDSLVNYSQSNMKWIKRFGDDDRHESKRLQRRQREADLDKSKDPTLDDNYVNDDDVAERVNGNASQPADDGIPIDPLLFAEAGALNINGVNGDHAFGPSFAQPVAPTAPIVEKHHEGGKIVAVDVNGIRFEYLDEATSPQTNGFNQAMSPTQGAAPPPTGGPEQSNSEVDTAGAAQAYHQAMLQQMTSGRKGAAVATPSRAKSLMLKFHISAPKLAEIKAKPPRKRPEATILQSDLLPNRTSSTAVKRRLTREEQDEEFSTRKKVKKANEPRPKTRQSMPSNFQPNFTEASDSEEEITATNSFTPLNRGRKERQLPAYLARRSLGVLQDREQGRTSSLEPGKRKRKRKRTPKANAAAQASAEKSRTNQPRASRPDHDRLRDDRSPSSPEDEDRADAFPPKPLPQSEPGVDLSRLGPGEAEANSSPIDEDARYSPMDEDRISQVDGPSEATRELSPMMDEAARRAEENRKAKMRAMLWAEGGEDNDYYDDGMDAY